MKNLIFATDNPKRIIKCEIKGEPQIERNWSWHTFHCVAIFQTLNLAGGNFSVLKLKKEKKSALSDAI